MFDQLFRESSWEWNMKFSYKPSCDMKEKVLEFHEILQEWLFLYRMWSFWTKMNRFPWSVVNSFEIMAELEQRISRRRRKMTREQEFVIVGTLIAGYIFQDINVPSPYFMRFTFNILAQSIVHQNHDNDKSWENSNMELGSISISNFDFFSKWRTLANTLQIFDLHF